MKKFIIFTLVLSLLLSGCSLAKPKNDNAIESIGVESAKTIAENFIRNNLVEPESTAHVSEVTEESGLYKVKVNVPEGDVKEINSYLSIDGKKFFTQAIDIEEYENKAKGQENNQEENKEVSKSDKPKVELFVMSHCPYGTQIEKGIIPAVETLGDSIDFELMFCDYAMHGKKELDEQLNQHCIQKNEPNKLLTYLNCFLADGDSNRCLGVASINQTKLNSCVDATDKQYKVTEKFNDKSTWKSGKFPEFGVNAALAQEYGVKGSPTLVINGAKANSSRDANSLLKTICSSFVSPPEECKKTLTSTPPSAGFGTGSGSDSGADCGS